MKPIISVIHSGDCTSVIVDALPNIAIMYFITDSFSDAPSGHSHLWVEAEGSVVDMEQHIGGSFFPRISSGPVPSSDRFQVP